MAHTDTVALYYNNYRVGTMGYIKTFAQKIKNDLQNNSKHSV